jgi:hypothetical protein
MTSVSRIARVSARRISSHSRVLGACAWPTPDASSSEMRRCFNTTNTTAASPVPKTPNSSLLLETAAKEAQQLFPRVHSNRHHQQQVQDAMNAAEKLLNSTKSTQALAETIRSFDKSAPHTVALHRAFLTVTQWCVSLTTTTKNKNNSNSNAAAGTTAVFESHMLEHPLLDVILQLSNRAHQLGLGFHLPLYKSVCGAVSCQSYSIHSPSQWILKLAQWARLELGPLPHDFLDESLLELTKRQKRTDVVAILQGMHERLQISSLNEQATKEILMNLKGSIRSMYQKQANWTLEEEDCREIVCLLESSIWKLVDQQHHIDTRPDMLRDAIEGIFNKTENDLLSTRTDHQEEMEELLQETTELMDCLMDMEHLNDGDMMILDDPDMLYTRPLDCKDSPDIPDITSQIMGENKTLRYSKDMERHIYFQFCPMDDDNDTDDEDNDDNE